MKKTLFSKLASLTVFILVLSVFYSCSPKATLNKVKIIAGVEEVKEQLPMDIIEGIVEISDVEVDDDMLIMTIGIEKIAADNIDISSAIDKSDEFVVELINVMGGEFAQMLVDSEMGLCIKYTVRNNGNVIDNTTISPSRFASIKRSLDNGNSAIREGIRKGLEENSSSVLDDIREEIDSYDFPVEVAEGVFLTGGRISGNNVYYDGQIDIDINDVEFNSRDLRESIVSNLISQDIIRDNEEEIKEIGLNIIYTYYDRNDEEITRVTITPDDLFN